MKTQDVYHALEEVLQLISANKSYLVQLDQAFGDGDLGVSMEQGFAGVLSGFDCEQEDLGKLFLKISRDLNESAPSSLGTILSFGWMGMAKALRGKKEASSKDFVEAVKAGVENIQQKAGSQENEKTILDALLPAVRAMKKVETEGYRTILQKASEAATIGADNTKRMIAVHGRAAYHGEKTLGHIDGGAYVAKLIFDGVLKSIH